MSAVAERGVPRAERAEQAAALRRRGMTIGAIAQEIGVSVSYASALLADPTGEKDRARKRRYCGTCERCGAATDGSNGYTGAPKLCSPCSHAVQHENRRWTASAVIEAIQRYAREFGHPPKATAWQVPTRPEYCPPTSAVYRGSSANVGAPFATWADAIEAAGFPRPRVGKRPGDRHWSPDAIVVELRDHAVDGVVVKPGQQLYNIARYYFGSWSAACAAAGVKPWRDARGWTRERVIATLHEHADGPLAPRARDIPTACVSAMKRLFGSWVAALDAAGLVRVPGGFGSEAARARLKQQLEQDPPAGRMPAAETAEASSTHRERESSVA